MAKSTDNYPNLGKNIRGLRKAFGETQLDLSLAIGVVPAAISQYESGERIPERDSLLRIAKHYLVTENELLHGDYEHMPNMTKVPLHDNDYNTAMLSKLFPLVCTAESLENIKFKDAYDLHRSAIAQISNGEQPEYEKIELCMTLYKAAANEGVEEGRANHLWWLMFWGFLISFATPRLMECLEILDASKITFKDIIDSWLPSFDEEGSESEYDTDQNRLEFLEENEVDIVVDIALLRKSKEYSDLGDYYLSLRHKFSLLSNSQSAEMNSAVGSELLATFALMGNKYCKTFLEPLPTKEKPI